MPKYQPGDENKYFPAIIGALIIIVGSIGYFIWSLLRPNNEFIPATSSGYMVENIDGIYHVNPGNGNIPDSPPRDLVPLSAPPAN